MERKMGNILQGSFKILTFLAWSSAFLFGIYILFFYLISFFIGHGEKWNNHLPSLYDTKNVTSTAGIGIHFVAGGLILILGCIQMINKIRIKFPKIHRWSGRIYVVSAIIAGFGGLAFIIFKGTIGGLIMDVAFGLYGVLMIIAAIYTWKFARQKKYKEHREWALRLFALGIGSWLYRIEYGFCRLLFNGVGQTNDFKGWVDKILIFAFYIPNLFFIELYIKDKLKFTNRFMNILLILLVWVAISFTGVGTYFFAIFWIKDIISIFK